MSPLDIQIALHYWSRVNLYAESEPLHAGSSAVAESKARLVKAGLLVKLDVPTLEGADYCRVYEPMKLYVETLCAVPYPTKVEMWVISHE